MEIEKKYFLDTNKELNLYNYDKQLDIEQWYLAEDKDIRLRQEIKEVDVSYYLTFKSDDYVEREELTLQLEPVQARTLLKMGFVSKIEKTRAIWYFEGFEFVIDQIGNIVLVEIEINSDKEDLSIFTTEFVSKMLSSILEEDFDLYDVTFEKDFKNKNIHKYSKDELLNIVKGDVK